MLYIPLIKGTKISHLLAEAMRDETNEYGIKKSLVNT